MPQTPHRYVDRNINHIPRPCLIPKKRKTKRDRAISHKNIGNSPCNVLGIPMLKGCRGGEPAEALMQGISFSTSKVYIHKDRKFQCSANTLHEPAIKDHLLV